MSGLLPYEAYYINSKGERLTLSEPPFIMNESRLFDAKWSLSTVQRPLREGVRLLMAKRPCEERSMTVHVLADDAAQLAQRLDHMSEIFDRDTASLEAGTLWINGQYMRCWCCARTKTLSCDFVSNAIVSVSVFPETPVWCTERVCQLDQSGDGSDRHRYPYRYPYAYGSGKTGMTLNNTYCAPCPMRITFTGRAENPSIFINGERIGIDIILNEGETAVIDQMTRQVYRITASGERENCFGARSKNGMVFEYAPPGVSTVVPDCAGVSIILIEQRSEPLWALS